MNHEKCQAFLKVIDKGSFSAAASELDYTPSGITRMINALETELGFPLLSRSPKGVQMTRDGQRLLPVLREIAYWHRQAAQISAEICGLETGSLTIGTYYSVAACWLPQIIKTFQNDFPHIHIDILEGGNSDLVKWLDERRTDCCFFSEYPIQGDWIPLRRDALVVWLPRSHPRASADAFPLQEINGAPFIKPLPSCNTDLERLLTREHLTPDIRFTTSDNYTAYSMVAAGLGISINNALMARSWSDDVVTLPFDPPQSIELGIAVPCRKELSPAARRFIACAQKAISCPANPPLQR